MLRLRDLIAVLILLIFIFGVSMWEYDTGYQREAVITTYKPQQGLTRLEKQLWDHEGFRSVVYPDPSETNFVVGVGRNIQKKGISEDEALYLLRNDIQECTEDLFDIFDNFGDLSEGRRMALLDMRFNLGPGGFREFKSMIQAVQDSNFDLAAHEMKNSRWYKQVGYRAERLRDMMLGVK